MSKTNKEKMDNMRMALLKSKFERTYWQLMVKYYAPNRIADHYAEVERLWVDHLVRVAKTGDDINNIPIQF